MLPAHRGRLKPTMGGQDRREEDVDQVSSKGEGTLVFTSCLFSQFVSLILALDFHIILDHACARSCIACLHTSSSRFFRSPRVNLRLCAAHDRDQDPSVIVTRVDRWIPSLFRGSRVCVHSPRSLRVPGMHSSSPPAWLCARTRPSFFLLCFRESTQVLLVCMTFASLSECRSTQLGRLSICVVDRVAVTNSSHPQPHTTACHLHLPPSPPPPLLSRPLPPPSLHHHSSSSQSYPPSSFSSLFVVRSRH